MEMPGSRSGYGAKATAQNKTLGSKIEMPNPRAVMLRSNTSVTLIIRCGVILIDCSAESTPYSLKETQKIIKKFAKVDKKR